MKHLITTLFMLCISAANAQKWIELMNNPESSFYDVQKEFYKYYRNKVKDRGEEARERNEERKRVKGNREETEEGELPGYDIFKRWEYYYAPRVYPSGDKTLVSRTHTEYQKYIEATATNKTAGNQSAQSSVWTALGPMGDPTGHNVGRINFIRFRPGSNTDIWIGSPAGGLWNTTNTASSWNINNSALGHLGCSDVAIDPTNNNVIYLATGDGDGGDTYSMGVFKSTDGGATWNATGLTYNVSQSVKVFRLLVHSGNSQIVIAATSQGIFRTTNGGVNWSSVATVTARDMEFKPGDPNTVYAAGTTFRKSTDAGATWTQISSGVPTSAARIAIGVTTADPTYVYLLSCNGSNSFQGVYRSTDSGTTFSTRTTSPNMLGYDANGNDSSGQGWYDLAIAVSPANKDELMIGGVHIWKSTNGGTSFTCKTHWYGGSGLPYCHADIHDLYYQNASTVWVACDGGVFKTPDGGSSWASSNGQMNISQFYDIGLSASDTNIIIGGLQDNSSVLKKASGWSRTASTGDGFVSFVDKNNNSIMYTSSYNGNFSRSTNGGGNWSGITSGLPNGPWKTDWKCHPQTTSILFAGFSQMYKSTNSGGAWSQLGSMGGSGDIVQFDIAVSDPNTIYAIRGNALYKTTNGGTSWTALSGLPTSSAQLTWVKTSSSDPNKVWVCFSGFSAANKVLTSTNGGSSWTNITNGLPNIPANCIAYAGGANDAIYLGMDIGVYYKDNSQSGWVNYSNGLPNVSVSDLEIFTPGGKLRAGTYGRGVWEVDLYNSGALPPVAAFASNQTVICPGQSINFTDQSSNNPTSWSWTFQGGTPSASTQQNPVVSYATPGVYAVSLTATNAAGNNTSAQNGYITVTGTNSLPLQESFAANTFPPIGWTTKDANNDGIFWTRSTAAGSQSTTSCMIFDNYNNDAGGGRDEIQTPKYNFSGLNSAALLFDVAYQQYDNTHSDTLVVLISTDCGVTFTKLYEKGGSTLSSVNGTLTSNLFTPSSAAQWRTETINLNAYVGQSNVMIVFQNRGHYGQALYIDQINLSSGSGINVLRPEQLGLTVYPNPSDGSFTCSFNGDTQNIYTIELSDMLGQVLHTEKIQGGAFSKVFTLREKGMYMVSINSTDGRFCKKIIVE